MKITDVYNSMKTEQKYPDAWKHKVVSFVKSATRIVGYALLPVSITYATIVLVLSEVIGIYEEMV